MLNFGASQSALGGLERSRVTGRWTHGSEQKVERPEKEAEETARGKHKSRGDSMGLAAAEPNLQLRQS